MVVVLQVVAHLELLLNFELDSYRLTVVGLKPLEKLGARKSVVVAAVKVLLIKVFDVVIVECVSVVEVVERMVIVED